MIYEYDYLCGHGFRGGHGYYDYHAIIFVNEFDFEFENIIRLYAPLWFQLERIIDASLH